MNRIPWILLVSSLFLMNPISANAKELNGVTFDEEMQFSGQKLLLNGLGQRIAFGFFVKVYVGGLYVAEKSCEPDALLAQKTPRRLELKFQMGVDKDKIKDAWDKGYKDNCGSNCGDYAANLGVLKGWMTDMREKQNLVFAFFADRLEVEVKGEKKGEIKDPLFTNNVLRIFLGPNPPNKELKTGLLGDCPKK
ncbi:MAG: chalcone isomerase family protein [Bdellovibrionales bacterium]|nr:chalcone isomerase family protein [Bdellovibrionales bacterium]